MMRACIVQGSQQVWVAALWYWGFQLNGASANSMAPWWIAVVLWPAAAISFLFAYVMQFGLPGELWSSRNLQTSSSLHWLLEYYRQTPPKVPSFMKTLFRRKLVLW